MSQMTMMGGRPETAERAREQMHVEPLIGPRKMGVIMFLGSESILFLTVIAQYVHGQSHPNGPTPQQQLHVLTTLGFSVALWLSSLTVQLAPHAARRRQFGLMRLWLWATVVLGAIFLYGESTEWFGLFNEHITASSNIWTSTFFTLTGIHGIHVIVGLCFLLGTIGFSHFCEIPDSNDSGLEIVTIYWHFVDGMWVLIFGTIYVWSSFLAR